MMLPRAYILRANEGTYLYSVLLYTCKGAEFSRNYVLNGGTVLDKKSQRRLRQDKGARAETWAAVGLGQLIF